MFVNILVGPAVVYLTKFNHIIEYRVERFPVFGSFDARYGRGLLDIEPVPLWHIAAHVFQVFGQNRCLMRDFHEFDQHWDNAALSASFTTEINGVLIHALIHDIFEKADIRPEGFVIKLRVHFFWNSFQNVYLPPDGCGNPP